VTSRLVLGCGTFGRRLALDLGGRHEPLLVLDPDGGRVDGLRDEGIRAQQAETTDPGAIRRRATDPLETVDTVVVAGDDPAENRAAAEAANEAFPDAFLLAYTGRNPTGTDRTAVREVADDAVDEGTATAESLRGRIDEPGHRTRRLRRVLRSLDGPLAVVAHDNPDPDAISSAVALERIAETAGLEAEVCYYGEINHQENRAFVNLLDYDLTALDAESELDRFGSFAIVDHSRPGVNDGLPPETEVSVVIDHHPPRAPVEARFVDLRSNVGATSTLLAGYLRDLGVDPGRELATGLLFGIRVDTDDFSREVDPEDFRAAAFLHSFADTGALERIESPSMSPETMDAIAAAIGNREVRDDVLVTCLGTMSDRDALAQAADRLLMLENVTTSVVYGFADGTIYVSARARSTEIDLGETLRDAFGKIGSAGGHVDMAGAQITMGVLEATDEREESLEQIVESVVADRFLEAADTYLTEGPARVYTPETAEEYLEPGADIDRREPPAEEGEGIGPGRALSDDGDGPPPTAGSEHRTAPDDGTGAERSDDGTAAERSDGETE